MRQAASLFHLRSGWAASFWYLVLTVALTWPLSLGLGRDLPRDLGDPLLNTWILAWGAHRLWSFVTGDLTALAGFWSANIFYPERLTLAYSETLIPQVLQILPVYGVTKNVILCYNLVFVSTFVLSGLGTYLFVRELTRDARAAFVSGLLYAFALYRVCQFPHVQVLSSQWMPFVLYGFRRYFDGGRPRALVGAGIALWAQNLSCGYYMFFFAPFVGVYLVYEIVSRGRWRDRRALVSVAAALFGAMAATVPFLIPYIQRGIKRPFEEIVFYSADVYSYLTSFDALRLWGTVARAFPKPEGELFPGVTPVVLALAAVVLWAVGNWRHATATARDVRPRWRVAGWLAAGASVVLAIYLVSTGVLIARGRTIFYLSSVRIQMTSIERLLQAVVIAGAVLLACSPRARAFARGLPGSMTGFVTAALVAAVFCSLGPRLKTMGEVIGTGPYALLLMLEPGMDSVRVPARFAMVVALFLAVLGGLGAAALMARWRRAGIAMVVACSAIFLVEGNSAPIQVNIRGFAEGLRLPEYGPMRQGNQVPPVYRAVAALPAGSALVEFPFGAFTYEFRYMFYSTNHWTPLLNGYSGYFPPSYDERRAILSRVSRDPDRAWQLLRGSGATHAIVHESFYADSEGSFTNDWLVQHGATLLGTFEGDRLYGLPKP